MSEKQANLTIGVDFGSDSVRALVVDAATGEELGSAVHAYTRWAAGKYCDPSRNVFRQHPLDFVEGLEAAVRGALAATGSDAGKRVRGLTIDTTGSTPVFADAEGTPLAMKPGFAEDPDAMFVLWKDHSAVDEAAEINALAKSWGGVDFTRYEGGVYSSEWFWAKVLHLLRGNAAVAAAAATAVEHCDWMPALLTGTVRPDAIKRSRCAAGHKAMWHADWGGYPKPEFLARLDPRLVPLAASLGTATWTAEVPAGKLTAEWAGRLGLTTGAVVSVGAFDAHIGAVGGDVAPGTLLKVMGTSTCDMLIGAKPAGQERLVAGICGQVDGSVAAGWIGYEAGQSAFGDVYAWFKRLLSWPFEHCLTVDDPAVRRAAAAAVDRLIPELEKAAAALPPGANGVVASDWLNGRRTPDADQRLTGAIAGLALGTEAPAVFRALVEATAFGSRAIVERFRREGVAVQKVAAIGGVARKSPFVMQTVADVLNMEIAVTASDQSCALGAAMFAAVAAGLYPDVLAAQKAMSAGASALYKPDAKAAAAYDGLYRRYLALGAFIEGRPDTAGPGAQR
jgi:L-ribulokinase